MSDSGTPRRRVRLPGLIRTFRGRASSVSTNGQGAEHAEPAVRRVVNVPLRLRGGKELAASMATFHNLRDAGEHLAVIADYPTTRPPLVRLHSECLTGDLFGSQRCDCGGQLREALRMLAKGGGILLYLRQEGRGIGLYNKLDSYQLQDSGLDTFEANRKLHFADDLRDYGVAADMLRALGVTEVRLLSNNPDKVRQLIAEGLAVAEVVPTGVYVNRYNRKYLEAKMGHAGERIAFRVADLTGR